MNDRKYNILNLNLRNPIVVGSGLLSDQEKNIRQLISIGAGAVVTKTIYSSPSSMNNERIYHINTGMLNSTTYSKRSIDHWLNLLREFSQENLPIIASIHADTPEGLGELAERIASVSNTPLELGISCLHAGDVTEDTPDRIFKYADAVRSRTDTPFSVKLALGANLSERVEAAIEGGAQALTLSDTIPGLAIDLETGQPCLGGVYGYSGPGIKPLVLAAIYNLRKSGIVIPILGSGGAKNGDDIREFLLAGADIVQVYTALHYNMCQTLNYIIDEYHNRATSLKIESGNRKKKSRRD